MTKMNSDPEVIVDNIKIAKVDNVSLVERFKSCRNTVGALYLTATHLIYKDHDTKRETWILHSHISTVTKLALSTSGSPLAIRTKTFLSMTFIIPKERDAHDLFTSLTQMCQPAHLDNLYCFRYNTGTDDLPRETGWSLFDLQAEFVRMGVPNESWTITTLNKDYELCDTYPRYLYVPSSVPTPVLLGSAKFRSRGRLPVLSYLHSSTNAAMCRCSQPLSGFKARCVEDEQLITSIQKANPNTAQLVVVDTRPKINAIANRAAGKGYESEAYYENTSFHFAGIDNIHVMRASLNKILETCELKTPAMNAFLNGVESSGWLRHIKAILDSALFIAKTLEQGSSVLVHCSDGWDRTAQVCSLSQILIDPYYRTLHGFQALIIKEWLSFGHKFTDRCAHIQVDPKEVSPVFTQWLECVWHLTQQFPFVFQFNSSLLLHIHDHVHSCQFGTFVGNCQRDRLELQVEERTYSLWGYIANHMNEYLNPLYRPELNAGFIQPNLTPQIFRFWREMYCRWENGIHPRECLSDLTVASKDHINSLEDHIRLLSKKIQKLLSSSSPSPKLPSDNSPSTTSSPNAKNTQHHSSPTNTTTTSGSNSRDISLLLNNSSSKVLSSSVSVVNDPLRGGNYSPHFSHDRVRSEEEEDEEEEKLCEEFHSVALEWRSVRGVKECSCSAPLDFTTRKSHCWRCGEIFCSRCLDKWATLPGHLSVKHSPVCKKCYRSLHKSFSVESPD